MIKNYLKIAWRNLIKNRTYSLINITGLSIGLAVCILITLFVKDELSFDSFQENRNQLYRLVVDETTGDEQFSFGTTGMKHGIAFMEKVPEITNMARVQGTKMNVKFKNEILVQDATLTDSSFFDLFSVTVLQGNAKNALKDPYSVVISSDVAKQFFGSESAIGHTLSLAKQDSFNLYTVRAVIANPPKNSSLQTEMLIPFNYSKIKDMSWLNFYLNTFLIIPEKKSLAKVEKKINAIYQAEAKEELAQAKKEWGYNSKMHFSMQPFGDMHLGRKYQAGNGLVASTNIKLSYTLIGIALFILLIACVNFVNIAISHSLQRAKEIGMRKVMGGQKAQLIWQFMSESLLLTLGAFSLALLFAILLLPIFNNITSKSLDFSYLLDAELVTIFAAIFGFTALLAGFYPSLVLSRYKPVDTLYGKIKSPAKNFLLKSLVVFQFGLSTFFIIMAIIQYEQVHLFTSKDLGYNDENVILINSGGSDAAKGEVFIQEIKKNKDIVSVAPRNFDTWVTVANVNGDQQVGPDMNVIDESFLPTIGLTIKQGRNFSSQYPGDSTMSILVNEAFVREAGWKNAIGQNVKVMNRDVYQVVGVVSDYHFSSLYEKVRPQVFTCNNSYGGYGTFYIRSNGKNVTQTLDFLQAKFHEVFPAKPYAYNILADINDRQYTNEFQMRQLIIWSAIIVIFISCMGIIALSILTTQKRRKEIGVRKVLGASLASIAQMLSLNYIKLVALGFIIFAPIAWFAGNRLLQNYPYRITIGVSIFCFALCILLVISILAVSFQSIKAAMANPVKSLRTA